jgi:hypothetical protein
MAYSSKHVETWCVLLCLALVAFPGRSSAEVYHSKESALRLAFPDADTVDKREIFLSGEQAEQIGELAGVKLPSRLVTLYVGRKDGRVTGYAFIDTHKVRSLPETLLVVLDSEGLTRGVYMLAFHEPPEYAPTDRWLGQFEGRPLNSDLSLRGEVDGITGATLTANAVTATVRSVLAVFKIALESG